MKRKKKDEFSERNEVTGKDGDALLPTTFTDDEKKELLGLLKK